jgi:hypothetical protein
MPISILNSEMKNFNRILTDYTIRNQSPISSVTKSGVTMMNRPAKSRHRLRTSTEPKMTWYMRRTGSATISPKMRVT